MYNLLNIMPSIRKNGYAAVFGSYYESKNGTFVFPELEQLNPKYVAVADGGLDFALSNNITPNIFFGDLDSISNNDKIKKIREKYFYENKNSVIMPKEKDDTDIYAVAKHITTLDFSSVVIYGGYSEIDQKNSDFGHTFANIQTLNFIATKNKLALLRSEKSLLIVLPENSEVTLTGNQTQNPSFSVFALSEQVETEILGGKYKFNGILKNDFPIAARNSFKNNQEIQIKSGKGKVLISVDFS